MVTKLISNSTFRDATAHSQKLIRQKKEIIIFKKRNIHYKF